MPDPAPPPPPPGAEPAPSSRVASRLQARFEGLDADELAAPPDSSGIEPGTVRNYVTAGDPGQARTGGRPVHRLDELARQMAVLRNQLDSAFDEYDQRLEAAETRASVAEARASVAEARASVAETRATDAEARANLAHTRIDEVVAYITGDDGTEGQPPPTSPPAPTLRGALDRLRDRLDVG
jgi:multidrug resistance efflux pump